ncbi:Ubiquitin carboxyl-terminal hydrolase family protein [Forsythia ovata]|uniref:Ubiquitin carboxyl-terminal hydrolase family protein n=1 Tax=Forsythia ovata TaxID=205694 RepID=A0ABD1PZ45_9LAMI
MMGAQPLFEVRRKFIVSLFSCYYQCILIHKRTLVNVKLKWVKDPVLDSVVSRTIQLKATSTLVSVIGSHPDCSLPIYSLSKHRGHLGLPQDLKISAFIRRYPNIFQEFYLPDSKGSPVPWYKLTSEALKIYDDEKHCVLEECYMDILNRLQKLLMLTKERLLPLQTIDQLRWDLGLPYDYENKMVAKHPELFSFVKLSDERVALKLLVWDDRLSVSHLELNNSDDENSNQALAFPIGFTRGFGLKKKCIEWLNEWQKLPYTSPYIDASHLDPRTDVSEKRIVGVFHELLHLTILKKAERKNVSNMRSPLALPQKFTKVFERHPGIFYISKKGDTQTVVLREAYDRDQLIEKHPLAHIREKYGSIMKKGFLDRSRGLYKKERREVLKDDMVNLDRYEFESEEEIDGNLISDYDSDETGSDYR